jgi:alginate O-acetyltransferase complex protein AlgI
VADLVAGTGARLSLWPAADMPDIVLPLGISYVIFRLVHYMVETYRRKAPAPTFVQLGMYVLFFPTFLAGPVDRIGRVHPQIAGRNRPDLAGINSGLLRLLLGIVRKFAVADTLARLIMPVLHAPADYSRWIVVLCVYGLAIRVYMDFAGYTDMAIGVARLFGYKIMENFNKPFLQKNIAMFWRNWHISVYSWIRDYFFFPFFGYRASNRKIYIGVFVSMCVFMLWHEANLPWLTLGVYHGLGLVVWHAFQEWKRQSPPLRKLLAHRWLDPLSIALTFTFVTFGFLIFSLELGEIASIMRRIF